MRTRPGRAGRDLRAATAVGVGMATLVLVPLFAFRVGFVVVVGVAVCFGLYELTRALATTRRRLPLPPMALGSVIMLWQAWSTAPTTWSWPSS